jgi:thiamine monophosphate synthase
MQNKKTSLYSQAHLMVAAMRVYEHLNSRPPTVDDVCRVINISVEQGYFICRKLQDIDIIKAVEGSYGTRLFINDHLKLEDLPRDEPENKLEDDLKKFQSTQKALSQKIETFQAQQKQKKKDLFAEMEKKLKEELEKK